MEVVVDGALVVVPPGDVVVVVEADAVAMTGEIGCTLGLDVTMPEGTVLLG